MTLDCNVTLGNWPFRRPAHNTPVDFVALMDRNEVDQALTCPFEGIFYKSAYEANEDFRAKLAGFEDRLKQLAVVNPTYPLWEDELYEYIAWGAAGIRVYPSYHGYELSDPAFETLLEKASEADLPVQIAVRVQDERLHHELAKVAPVDLSRVGDLALEFPTVPLVILNASNPEAARPFAESNPENLFVDIAHIEGIGGVGKLARDIGAEHVVFGSHAPFLYLESALLKMLEADLSDAEKALIQGENAKSFFAKRRS